MPFSNIPSIEKCPFLNRKYLTIKWPSMPFQIALLYDKMLKGMPFQMPFQIV